MIVKRSHLIAALLGAAAVVALAFFLLTRPNAQQGAALDARQQALEMLGARIASLLPQCQALVLSNPFARNAGFTDERNRFEQAGIRGLSRALGKNSSVKVVYPEIRADYLANPASVAIPSDARNPLSFLMEPGSVDALAKANPRFNMIVSLIGLPVGVDQLGIWDEKDPRSFALLLPDLRLLGPPEKVVEAFQRGKILAAVAQVEGSPAPLIITKENVAEVLERHPSALGF